MIAACSYKTHRPPDVKLLHDSRSLLWTCGRMVITIRPLNTPNSPFTTYSPISMNPMVHRSAKVTAAVIEAVAGDVNAHVINPMKTATAPQVIVAPL